MAIGKVLIWKAVRGLHRSVTAAPPAALPSSATFMQSRGCSPLSGAPLRQSLPKAVARATRIRFDADLALGEDQLFQATAMVHAASIAMIEDTVYFYHHYSESSVTGGPRA